MSLFSNWSDFSAAVPRPVGVWNKISRIRKAIFECGKFVSSWERNRDLRKLKVPSLKRTLSSLIVQANVTIVTIHIIKCVHCYLCFTLWLSVCRRWPVMRLQAYCGVLNAYGVNAARFLFDAIELECFWCSTKRSHQKLCTKALSIRVPCINTQQHIFANMDFPLYFVHATRIRTIWTFEHFARGSD